MTWATHIVTSYLSFHTLSSGKTLSKLYVKTKSLTRKQSRVEWLNNTIFHDHSIYIYLRKVFFSYALINFLREMEKELQLLKSPVNSQEPTQVTTAFLQGKENNLILFCLFAHFSTGWTQTKAQHPVFSDMFNTLMEMENILVTK